MGDRYIVKASFAPDVQNEPNECTRVFLVVLDCDPVENILGIFSTFELAQAHADKLNAPPDRFVVEHTHMPATDKYLYHVYDNQSNGKDHVAGVFITRDVADEHAKDLNERHRSA